MVRSHGLDESFVSAISFRSAFTILLFLLPLSQASYQFTIKLFRFFFVICKPIDIPKARPAIAGKSRFCSSKDAEIPRTIKVSKKAIAIIPQAKHRYIRLLISIQTSLVCFSFSDCIFNHGSLFLD